MEIASVMTRKTPGVYQDGNRYVVVFHSADTRDGYRSISFPADAEMVLREHYKPQPKAAAGSRRSAVLEALKAEGKLSLGKLLNTSLESVGEDTEDMALRRRMLGLINSMAEDGEIIRDDELVNGRKRETFRLPG